MFRVRGLGFQVWVLGLRASVGLGIWGFRVGVWGLGFQIWCYEGIPGLSLTGVCDLTFGV